MRTTVALLALIALLATGARADAALPDPAQILATSRVPVVTGLVITYGHCPYTAFEVGCTWPDGTVIVDGDALAANGDPAFTVPPIVLHEAGHVFAQHVGPGVVRRFARLTKPYRTREGIWVGGHRTYRDVIEQFADAYAECATGAVPKPSRWGDMNEATEFPTGYEYDPTPRQHRNVCAMMRRAGARV